MNSVPSDATLGDLGLDSMMGAEVKQALEREYSIVLTMKDITQLTVKKLEEMGNSHEEYNNVTSQSRKGNKLHRHV